MQHDESLPEDLRNVSVYRRLITEYMIQASPSILPVGYYPVMQLWRPFELKSIYKNILQVIMMHVFC